MGNSKRIVAGLIRGDNRYDIVSRALAEIAHTVDLSRTRRILVKPNFVSTTRQLASTHVDAIRAVLEFLRDRGAGHIVIAEYAGGGWAMDGFRNFGYSSLVGEYDVELIDLAQEDWVDATIVSRALQPEPAKVSRRVVESDFRVSVAPIKTHNTVITTLALKNMAVGALRDRVPLHQEWPAINLSLYGLAPLVRPHLSVLDGFQGMEGDGPGNGDPVDLRVAVASSDFVAADTVGTLLMDHDPRQVGYLVHSHRGGLGEGDVKNIKVLGNCSVDEAKMRFRKHPTYQDQLGWRTNAADRLVLSGSRGAIDWKPSSNGFVASSTNCPDCEEPESLTSLASQPCDTAGSSLSPATVAIPAGRFVMGDRDGDGQGEGIYEIDLPGYRIGLHPVTNEQYAQFVIDGGYTERWKSSWTEAGWRFIQDIGLEGPRWFKADDGLQAQHPVVGVSWHEARAYAVWLTTVTDRDFALPTEAQWEKAARGVSGRRYPWGEDWEPGRCNSAEARVGNTTPVMKYPGGCSGYDVYDMAGNVWEWCSSTFKSYPYRSDDGREDPSASGARVVRGGSWFVGRAFIRSAFRNFYAEAFRGDHLGFRIVES